MIAEDRSGHAATATRSSRMHATPQPPAPLLSAAKRMQQSAPSDQRHSDANGVSWAPTRRASGGALVTDCPFTESVEQVVGFYLVESDDEADLRAACERFARGELIELRRLAE
ncbi:MAG: hypothetical protein ACXVGC_03465 [Mycobacteriaceae bacterium]